MRTLALTEAETDPSRAMDLMAIAADWSLRDDIAHGWLFAERLKRGQASAALAHADVLARRRPDAQPRLIAFLLTASAADPRLAALVKERLKTRPPWRAAFFSAPVANDAQAAAKTQLAIALKAEGTLDSSERAALYTALLAQERFTSLRQVRTALEPEAPYLVNGGFEDVDEQAPFGWTLAPAPGWTMEVRRGPAGSALHLDYDGFSGGVALQQFLLLPEGRYRFSWSAAGSAGEALKWRLDCVTGGAELAQSSVAVSPHALDFEVEQACSAQRLSLVGRRGERRRSLAAVIDSVHLVAR